MLDTMLGSNDGAPFVWKIKLVSDSVIILRYARILASVRFLNNPRVMSQGTLKGPDTTTPDRFTLLMG